MSNEYGVGKVINYASVNAPEHNRKSRESRLSRIIFASLLTLATIGGSIGIYYDKKEERKAYNSVARTAQYCEIDILKGDSYWKYATKLRRENSYLRTLKPEKIIDALQELNGRKSLIIGDKVKIPVF